MSVTVYRPKEVGELFWIVMPDGYKRLARVTEINSPDEWTAVPGDLDDAMHLTYMPQLPLPEFHLNRREETK